MTVDKPNVFSSSQLLAPNWQKSCSKSSMVNQEGLVTCSLFVSNAVIIESSTLWQGLKSG